MFPPPSAAETLSSGITGSCSEAGDETPGVRARASLSPALTGGVSVWMSAGRSAPKQSMKVELRLAVESFNCDPYL